MKSPYYYVRSEGWERCADCARRIIDDLHEDLLSCSDTRKNKETLERIKQLEEEQAVARRRAKQGSWFNRLEHGCLCCTYEDEYGEGQAKSTETIQFWAAKLTEQHEHRRNHPPQGN